MRGMTTMVMAAMMLAGCNLYPDLAEESQEAVPVREKDRQFQDIPVPRNFACDEKSFADQHGRYRVCNLFYYGPLDVGSTTEFMDRQMKQAGWRPMERSLVAGRNILTFSKDTSYAKDGEVCTVTIQRRPSERKTLLMVTVKPAPNEPIPAPAPRTEP